MMIQRRCFSVLHNQLRKEVIAPFKTNYENKRITVDKNIPTNRQQKAWERDGEDKDTWFRRKYAHVHARSKIETRGRRSSRELDDPPPRRSYNRDPVSQLQPSPFHDYLYGVGPVIAALRANKREVFSELLIHNPKERHSEILQLAKERDVICKASTKMELNQLTNNNVHNGYVLKTKPLLPQEIVKLSTVEDGIYRILKADFGQEVVEEFEVARREKNPLGIYLDEISDPHNVGLIIRTAYFLGVDFIVMSEKNCSKLTPAVCKASSGAMEFLPIYSTDQPVNFFRESQENGWKFISSAIASNKFTKKQIVASDLKPILDNNPCVLVFGSEGHGIRTNLMMRSDHLVSLKGGRVGMDDSIDSLNVSVAAGLLLQKFLE